MAEKEQINSEYLVEVGKKLAVPIEKEVNGRLYINKELRSIEEPLRSALSISTLGSLVELCVAKLTPDVPASTNSDNSPEAFESFSPAKHVIHVVDEGHVQVVSGFSNVWAKRETLIDCKLDVSVGFKFGQYLGHEDFIVGVLANFTDAGDRDYVLRIASNITAERVVQSEDDGIGQTIGVKAGVSLKKQEDLKGRVKLAPYRTFREIEQPVSEFVFRVKQSADQVPLLGLFEADGGKWKIDARENISRFLSAGIPGAVVAN